MKILFPYTLVLFGMIALQACFASEDPAFEEIQGGSPLGYFAARQNGKWGFINSDHQVKIGFEYDSVCRFLGEITKVGKANKYGYIDTSGRVVIPLEYDDVCEFVTKDMADDTIVWVKKMEKYGFVNTHTGKLVTPLKYEAASFFGQKDYVMANVDGAYKYVDRKGKEVEIPGNFEFYPLFGEYFAERQLQGWRVVHKDHMADAPTDFYSEMSRGYESELIKVRKNGLYGYVNIKHEVVVPCIYKYCGFFSDGLCRVEKDGKTGFVNTKGQEVIPVVYDDAFNFHNGLAIVGNKRLYGAVDSLNHQVIPLIYQNFGPLGKDCRRYLGFIRKEGSPQRQAIVINKNGKKELELPEDIYYIEDNDNRPYYIIREKNLFGIKDSTGKVVVPAVWTDMDVIVQYRFLIRSGEGDYIKVKNENGEGVINIKNGKVVIKPVYEKLVFSGKPGVYIATRNNRKQLVKVNDAV